MFPTYHLASVVDDHEMKITHVIRGEVSVSGDSNKNETIILNAWFFLGMVAIPSTAY